MSVLFGAVSRLVRDFELCAVYESGTVIHLQYGLIEAVSCIVPEVILFSTTNLGT